MKMRKDLACLLIVNTNHAYRIASMKHRTALNVISWLASYWKNGTRNTVPHLFTPV